MLQEWIYIEQLPNGDVATSVDYIFQGDFGTKTTLATLRLLLFRIAPAKKYMNFLTHFKENAKMEFGSLSHLKLILKKIFGS